MVVQAVAGEVKDLILTSGPFGPNEIQRIATAIGDDPAQFPQLRDAVNELDDRQDTAPAAAVRLGVGFFLLGRYERAAETLAKADGGAIAHFYRGKALIALEQFNDAVTSFQAAQKAGYDGEQSKLAIVEAQRLSGNPPQALQTLDNLSGAIEQTAEYLYQRGATVAALGGNPVEVVRLYERAVEADDRHAGALFGLALENDRRGNDDTALRFYQRAAARIPSHVGTLLNMGLLFEDRDEYDKAQQCYSRILDEHPQHPRARLFLKDAMASREMYYDEESARKRDRMQ